MPSWARLKTGAEYFFFLQSFGENSPLLALGVAGIAKEKRGRGKDLSATSFLRKKNAAPTSESNFFVKNYKFSVQK